MSSVLVSLGENIFSKTNARLCVAGQHENTQPTCVPGSRKAAVVEPFFSSSTTVTPALLASAVLENLAEEIRRQQAERTRFGVSAPELKVELEG